MDLKSNLPIQQVEPDYDLNAYNRTAEKSIRWLPRIGGYDYSVTDELPENGPAIVCPKHIGMADIPLVGAVIHQHYNGKHARFVGKKELWQSPIFKSQIGGYFDRRGAISLDRKTRLTAQEASERIDRVLSNEEWLLLFGEGTRVKDTQVGKLKSGMGALAIKHGAPIQVFGISGTEHWFGKKYVVAGRVIYPESDIDVEDTRLMVAKSKEMMFAVRLALQEATDEANRLRTTIKVSIPFIRHTKPETKDK